MIKKFLGRIFSSRPDAQPAVQSVAQPRVIPFKSHRIAREQISRGALQTCETLQRRGFAAYVVGGAVRDLLLARTPKDYDVATDATPEEVRATFRRSRIIGRRFRLVHVMFGAETIEVSTFRGSSRADTDVNVKNENENEQTTDEHGRILRDNVFGTQEEDARRRDFTVNALFYDPVKQEIIDYHDGVADIKAKRLRMIGDATQRYREDPVRMLRAVRLSAARGLEIDAATRKPIHALADLIHNVPAARLFDEMMKLLLSGHAAEAVSRLRKEGLHRGLLPLLDVILEQPLGERFIMRALANTDERLNAGKPVSPGFLFAALLWHEVLVAWKQLEGKGKHTMPALFEAMDQVLSVQAERIAIPRRYGSDMKEIWALQPRFQQRAGARPYRLLEHPRFRAAYDFLLLRCEAGELDKSLGEWWTTFQHADHAARQAMLVNESGGAQKKRRRRRKPAAKKTPASEQNAGFVLPHKES